MPRLLRLGVVALVVTSFLTLSSRASADSITMTLDPGYTLVSYNPNGGAAVEVGGGPFHWTQTTPVNTNYATSITTYCIDLQNHITFGSTYTYTVETNLTLAPTIGNNPATVTAIEALFNKYYTISLSSTTDSAAFQLALWKLVYDGPSDTSLSSGEIQANNPLAQSMLNGTLASSNNDLADATLVALVDPGYQAQIMVVPNTPSSVPAPPALMLAGIGALALVGRARWLKRTA
jgi:hypothetical protein